jgi:hypothetical protein
VTVDLAATERPASWVASPTGFSPDSSGTVTGTVNVPSDGEYQVWLGGYVFGGAEIRVDGEETGSERGVLDIEGGWEPVGTAPLTAGSHTIELDYDLSVLHPGSGGGPFAVGPLSLDSGVVGDLGTVTVDSTDYQRFCGKRWDWIESRQ